MSALAGAITLPKTGGRARKLLGRAWQYLKVTGPLFLALAALKIPDAIGIAATLSHNAWFHVPVPTLSPVVRLALSTIVVVLGSVVGAMSRWVLFPLALARMLIADPINYLIGRRTADFVRPSGTSRLSRLVKWIAQKLESSPRFVRWVIRLVRWVIRKMESHPYATILLFVAVITFGDAFLPPFAGLLVVFLNPYIIAGAARVKLRWVMAVDVIASLAFLVFFCCWGPDLVGTLRALG